MGLRMIKNSCKYLLITVVALFPLEVYSASESDSSRTGNFWLTVCKQSRESCHAFTSGFLYGITAQAVASSSKRTLCTGSGMTLGQVSDIFVKYLQDHPERRHKDVIDLAFEAFLPAMPCD
jgi:hypothetical protein